MSRPTNVEFKAGKAKLEDKTVTSDPRKGYLKFSISPEGIICVQWREREKATIEDEYYFAPGDLQFVKVKNSPAGSRMYYLNFSDSGNKEFFWVQEPVAENDHKLEEGIKLIETYQPDDDENDDTMQVDTKATTPIEQPKITTPIPTSIQSSSSTGTKTTTTTTTGQQQQGINNSGINMELFKNIFSNLPNQNQNKNMVLSKLLTAENLKTFFRENEDARTELSKYLPEGTNSQEKLFEILHSPQYIQALEGLDYAIFEGNGSEISQLLGCGPSLSSMSGVEGFLTSIQESISKQKKQQPPPKKD